MQDPSSLTRDQTCVPCGGSAEYTVSTGQRGKSQDFLLFYAEWEPEGSWMKLIKRALLGSDFYHTVTHSIHHTSDQYFLFSVAFIFY